MKDCVNIDSFWFEDDGKTLKVSVIIISSGKPTYTFRVDLDAVYMGIDPESEFEDELYRDIKNAYEKVGFYVDGIKRDVERHWYGLGKYSGIDPSGWDPINRKFIG